MGEWVGGKGEAHVPLADLALEDGAKGQAQHLSSDGQGKDKGGIGLSGLDLPVEEEEVLGHVRLEVAW